MRHRTLAASLTLSTLMLIGCMTTTDFGGTTRQKAEADVLDEVCRVWLPIRWSRNDTAPTIRQVKAGNAARKAWGCV